MKVFYSISPKVNLSIHRFSFTSLVSEIVCFSKIKTSKDSEILIHFVSDKEICRINSKYMNHEGITDVISFNYLSKEDIEQNSGVFAEIFICVQKAELEAKTRKLDFCEELILYLVHGILHIAGFDDIKLADRRKMRQSEAKCMNEIKKHFQLSFIVSSKN